MKNLFSLDNPVFRVIERLADLVILGLLCLLCSIPVVTAGPAFTALFRAVYDLTTDYGGGVVKTYFRAFRNDFKQAAGVWLLALLGLASLLCDWILLQRQSQGVIYMVLVCIVVVVALLVVGLLCYIFPLISRYNNTLKEHVHNTIFLMIQYFPKTLLMISIQILPILMIIFMTDMLIETLLFWILLYPGLSAQANALLLRPVFEKLEAEAGQTT